MQQTLKPRVLLLSPPGDEIFIRDYYCSKVSKTTYIYTPVDLLIASGHLTPHVELKAIDAIAAHLKTEAVLKQIQEFDPDVIFAVTAAVSWTTDLEFFKKLKKQFKGKLIASGDVLMDQPTAILKKYTVFDAILMDFSSDEIVPYCLNKPGPFYDILMRDEQGNLSRKAWDPVNKRTREYHIDVPRHDLFPLHKYRYPFVRHHPFATVLTDFGCAFKCTFCIQSTLEFKTRPAENVIEELRSLKKMGIRDIYFSDQTFAYNLGRTKQILNAMIAEKMNFGWVAFYRVDLVKEETIKLFKEAGCHTLMFGIESANEEIQKDFKKFLKQSTIRKSLELCHQYGIRTVGTFIFGFPNETRKDIQTTIEFSLNLPLDYVSYNIAVPRSKTSFREEAKQQHFVENEPMVMDQSGKHPIMGNKHLSANELLSLRNEAIRRFYLRPKYLAQRIFDIRTVDDLVINVRDGVALLRETF